MATMGIVLDELTRERLQRLAERADRSVSAQIRYLINREYEFPAARGRKKRPRMPTDDYTTADEDCQSGCVRRRRHRSAIRGWRDRCRMCQVVADLQSDFAWSQRQREDAGYSILYHVLTLDNELVRSGFSALFAVVEARSAFDTWLKDTRLLSCQDDVFVVGAPSEFARDWLEGRLLATVERILVGMVGRPVEVRFVTREA